MILCLTVLLFAGCKRSGEYDIYLCIGQSNMAGRGELCPEDSIALDGVYVLDYDGVPVPAAAPLNRYSTIRKELSMQGMNPSWSFARRMYGENGRKILLVVNAKGGTSINLWTKDAPCDTTHCANEDFPDRSISPQFYQEAVRRTKEAMKYGQVRGILWHQGEGDGRFADRRDIYLVKLEEMVKDLRQDLGSDIPFVAGEVARDGLGKDINPVLDSIPMVIPNSACVSAEGLSTHPDNVHFDRESQIQLGIRYAEAMIALMDRPRH